MRPTMSCGCKNEGTMNVLPNDAIGGTIDAEQYKPGAVSPKCTRH